jgi:hypothetical protein
MAHPSEPPVPGYLAKIFRPVSVVSEGEGTTFAVTLPIPQTDQRLITYTGRMQ